MVKPLGALAKPSWELRSVTEGDYDFLYALHEQTMRPYVAATWGWDDHDQRQRFGSSFFPERLEVITLDGKDVGVLACERGADATFVSLIELAPAWHGRGLGTRILAQILCETRRRGVPVRLRVLKVNPALRLYERLGFVHVGDTATHHMLEAR
jgi:GNAT superfamily N-acetyltransferase